MRPLLKRSQASGAFNSAYRSNWMLTVLLELIHAASRDVTAATLVTHKAKRALIATITGAFSPPDQRRE